MNRRKLLTLGAGALGLASMGVGRFSRSTWREAQGRSDRGFMSQSQGASGSSLLDGLLGYWSLEGHSLNRVTGLTGTDTAVTYGAGKVGQAADFNGTTSKIVTPVTGPLGAAPRTVSCWVKPTASDGWVYGYGGSTSGSGFNLYLAPAGQFQAASWYAAPVANLGAFTLGQWHHVVVTYDGIINGAVNGVASTPTALTLNTVPTAPFTIGNGVDNHPFTGQIDEVAIWNRALSAGEIAQIYNAGAGRAWPF